jgi:hypothetical protein
LLFFPTYWFVLYFLAFLYFCRVSICLTSGSFGGSVWVWLGTPWIPKLGILTRCLRTWAYLSYKETNRPGWGPEH